MIKVCKIRCYPNQSQISKSERIFGICRFVRNKYIEMNRIAYNKDKSFISGYEFSRILNHLKKTCIDYEFINECSSKAIKDAIMIQERAYKNAFKRLKCGEKTSLPCFISRKRVRVESFFFIKDNIHFDTGKKNVIKIPILGNIRITQRSYLPDNDKVTSGRFIKEDDKYYLIFIYHTEEKQITHEDITLGIDLGIEKLATIYASDDSYEYFEGFSHHPKYQKLKKKYKKLQTIISKKAEVNYYRRLDQYYTDHPDDKISDKTKNIMKGESYNTSQIKKLQKKCRSIYRKMVNIRRDYIDKLVYYIVVRLKPMYVTIEDLSVEDMLSNERSDVNRKHLLHRLLAENNLSYFRERLTQKSYEYSSLLQVANRYFKSSKICSICGSIISGLSLSDRIFRCDCGNVMDRDLNAARNLCYCKRTSLV